MPSALYGLPELTGTTVERTSTNLNFRYIESLFGSVPTGVNVSTPPGIPTDGSVYLINSGGVGNPTPPTGIWSGKAGQGGIYTSSGWFYTNRHPQYTFGSDVWTQASGGGGGAATTNASLLTTGTLNDARLSTNVPLLVAKVNTFTKAQGVAPIALTDGASIAVDLSLSNNLTITTAGNRAFANPTNMVAGHSFNLFVTQDSVGTRVPTWGSAYKFGTNGVPTPSTNANSTDWYKFYCDGTNLLFEGIVTGFGAGGAGGASGVAAIIAEILAQGGTLTVPQQNAINTFFSNVSAFWSSKCVYFYGFMGGTSSSHAIDWKNIGSNVLTYGGTAATHSTNGVQFNGGYADTGLIPPIGNYCLSGYTQSGDSRQGTITEGLGAARFYGLLYAATHSIGGGIHSIPELSTSIFGINKHYAVQRTNGTTMETYSNGAIVTTFTESQVNSAGSTILLGILRYGGAPAYPQGPASVVQSYGLWQALTSAEVTALYNAEVALNSALGRA